MQPLHSANLSSATRQKRVHCHVLVFTSGKAGVGKTCITTNVATALANKGEKVCVLNADTGLENINNLLGIRSEYTLRNL